MWIVALIGAGVVTGLIQWGMMGFINNPSLICEIMLLHQFVVTFGLLGVIGFYINVVDADKTAKQLGWPGGPYQIKYGFSQLGIGVMGILCIWFKGGFWLGTLFTMYIYGVSGLWSHIAEMKRQKKVTAMDLGNIVVDVLYQVTLTVLSLQVSGVWN